MVLDLRRKFSALLVALLVFSLFSPGVALADPWYMGLQTVYVNDNASSFDSVVVAPNQFAAAAYVMGAEPQLLTDEQKSYLSDGMFCPNFCQYAASFQEFDPMAPPDWLPQYVYASLVASGIGVAAFGNKRYVSSASNFLYQDAKEELQAVLSGDYPSGGGDPVAGEFTSRMHLENYLGDATDVTMLINSVSVPIFNSRLQSMPYCTLLSATKYNSFNRSKDRSYFMEFSDVEPEIVVSQSGTNYKLTINYNQDANVYTMGSPGTRAGVGNSWPGGTWEVSGPSYNDIYARTYSAGTTRNLTYNGTYVNAVAYTVIGSTSGPSTPSGDWPADPSVTEPSAPELPEPDSNSIPNEPTETDISVNLPQINVTVGDSATDLTDVISILKVINGNLVKINDNLEDEFNSVINAFNAIGGQIEQLAQRIREHCQHIRTSIYQNTTHLENEIYKLFHWLKDELDYGFDDSSIVDYLRRILDKLNNVSYQPNPIAEPSNFFDWLMGLLGGFLASLVSGLPGVLQDLLTDLSSLTEYFPFSMPWDVYGLLLLFAHDPVTPVFDLPWNFAANHTAQIHIDLSQYDGIMAIVRAVEKVIFAAGLAVFTMKMFKPTDVLGDD